MPSLDPRIKRLELPEISGGEVLKNHEHWGTFEVFHLKKRGDHPIHVGSVHAPGADLALVFAKEQFGRRLACVSLWVCKSSDIHTFSMEDEDMFHSAVSDEKKYRDASGFKVRERINKYKNQNLQGLKKDDASHKNAPL